MSSVLASTICQYLSLVCPQIWCAQHFPRPIRIAAGDVCLGSYAKVFGRLQRKDWHFVYHRLSCQFPSQVKLTPSLHFFGCTNANNLHVFGTMSCGVRLCVRPRRRVAFPMGSYGAATMKWTVLLSQKIRVAFWETLGWPLATVVAKVRQRPFPGILVTRDTGKIVLLHYKSQPQNGNGMNSLLIVKLICAARVVEPRDKIIGLSGYWNSSQ